MTQPRSPGPRPDSDDPPDLLERFEEAWHKGETPVLEAFLSAAGAIDPSELQTLIEELIKIDMEYRWRRTASAGVAFGAGATVCPRLEEYVRRLPTLGSSNRLPLELIAWEYWTRHCWGDRPAHAEYAARFPELAAKLRVRLPRIDAELAEEFGKDQPPRVLNPARPHTLEPRKAAVFPAEPASSISSEALMDVLGRFQLLSGKQLEELSQEVQHRAPSPRELAKGLLQRQWLTAYQVNQLLQARGHELVLGPYVLLERLGEGGVGQVFKARHVKLNRVVALKVIRKELLGDAEVLGRFQREIRVLSQMDHPNIVHAYDAGAVPSADRPVTGGYFLAMEYIEGTDLGKLVKQGGPLPVHQACEYIRQAALGLQYAHERGLVHRDIKPHNLIMSVRDGLIKVADLGLARMPRTLDSEATATLGVMTGTGTLTPQNASLIGTADYLAPEQALDFHKADIRSDIYSLGCTFYYLLAGQPPFAGATLTEKLLKHQQTPPTPLEQFRQDLPAGLTELLTKMMSKRPEHRWQTPSEVALALSLISQGKPHPGARKGAWQQRRRTFVVVILCLLGLGLFLSLRSFSSGPGKEAERQGKEGPFAPQQLREFASPQRGTLHIVAFGPGGKLVAIAADARVDGNHVISLVDTATGTEQFRLPGHKASVSHLAISEDGRLLASGSVTDKTWKLWDLNRRQELAAEAVEAVFHREEPLVGPFSPDSKYLLVHPRSGAIDLLELASKKRVSFSFDACELGFSPDGRILALASRLGRVALFDLATRKEMVAGSPASGIHVYAVAFSPDSKQIAVASWNGEIYFLDAVTLKRTAICKEHKVAVLRFAPSGQTLVSGGRDSLVKLWDASTGQLRWTLEGHSRPVRAITFGPDGKTMFTGSEDGMVKVWRIGEY